jgi:hypothetical protein
MAEQSNNNEVLRTIKQLGDELLATLITEIEQQDLIASQKLINSLNYRVIEAIKFVQYKLEVRAVDYSKFAFDGRKPGKQPPLRAIQEWCTFKGFPKSMAFPIAQGIGKYGVPAKNVIGHVANGRAVNNFKTNIKEAYRKQIQEQIKLIITKGK